MKVSERVERIKISFNVTPQINRFVYIYFIIGTDGVYLIDTGVAGTGKIIGNYLNRIGKDITEVKNIYLTHSHPDHIGGAAEVKEMSNCKVWSCKEERAWIENIDKQFSERPIPNFYKLLNRPVVIDYSFVDGQIIVPEIGITLRVIKTPGHSVGSTSFLFEEEQILFTGDAIPVVGDIPIYTDYEKSIASLHKLGKLERVIKYCPAWSDIWDGAEGKIRIHKAIGMLQNIDNTVRQVVKEHGRISKEAAFNIVCERLEMQKFTVNALFRRSIFSNIDLLAQNIENAHRERE